MLKTFFSFLRNVHPAQVSGVNCQRWASAMEVDGLSKNTIKVRLAAVSSFYQFVCTRYEVEPDKYLHSFNLATIVQRPHVNPYEKSLGLNAD